jgi:hypothetical protein
VCVCVCVCDKEVHRAPEIGKCLTLQQSLRAGWEAIQPACTLAHAKQKYKGAHTHTHTHTHTYRKLLREDSDVLVDQRSVEALAQRALQRRRQDLQNPVNRSVFTVATVD